MQLISGIVQYTKEVCVVGGYAKCPGRHVVVIMQPKVVYWLFGQLPLLRLCSILYFIIKLP